MNKMKDKTQEYLEKKDEGYKSFGAYEQYKSNLINRLFHLTGSFHQYNVEYWNRNDMGDLFTTDVRKGSPTGTHPSYDKPVQVDIWTIGTGTPPDYFRKMATRLQNFIRLLKPKIKKLDVKDQPKYKLFEKTLKAHPDELLLDREFITESYELLIELMEELGYTDMSIKDDVDGERHF